MKFILAGGTGQVGQVLTRALVSRGHEVVVLTRRPVAAASARWVTWGADTLGPWCAELEGADVLINLAGRSVNCRYNQANRRAIMESRVNSTRVLRHALQAAARPPRVWLQSSTATLYAHRYDAANDENSGLIGGEESGVPDTWRFSIAVAKAWEEAAQAGAPLPATRLVLLRSAIIMSPDPGGAFSILLRLVRWGLGGSAGHGRQFVSWIHEADFVEAILFLVEQEQISGPVNLAAPEPLPNREFMRELRQAWGNPLGLPAAKWMLELGALFSRTETELVLKSRRVVPGRLLEHGFHFAFPKWRAAACELCARSRG